MRIWRKKTKNEIEKTIKAKIIDEVKKEYAEANPSAPSFRNQGHRS
jgi:tRNA A37 N6-isopentenylltransferase MiaA